MEAIHSLVFRKLPFVCRIAVALYDPEEDMVKTFIASDKNRNELKQYQAKLGDCSSLREIVQKKAPRIVTDISIFDDSMQEHNIKIKKSGVTGSYTLPIFSGENFIGFVFFDFTGENYPNDDQLCTLDLYGHLIGSFISQEIFTSKILEAALKTSTDMVHEKDPETGEHVERMARYARLIAQGLARKDEHKIDDEFVEQIFLFSPLHDIGKLGIPDEILQKPAKLSDYEFGIMKTHASKGRDFIDKLIKNFELEGIINGGLLRHIAELHHEAVDRSGYPHGLAGHEIPIEARIIAVADVFDALTSNRPYKKPWSNDKAFEHLRKMSRVKFDSDCVEALIERQEEVESIQLRFSEETH